jgi:endonuclease/exonuclease/phosphatase family metal-dependent hydrolase
MIRFLTYNIWDGGGERVAQLAAVIAAAAADVVLLNEADDERVVERLARELCYEGIWARGSGDKHIALLSRLSITRWRIHNRRPFTQAVLEAEIALPQRQTADDSPPTGQDEPVDQQWPIVIAPASIVVFGVHLMPYFMLLPYEVARWRTVRALLRMTHETCAGPHLLLGDFNAAMAGERADTRIFSAAMRRRLWLQANRQPRLALPQITRAGYLDCFRHLHPTAPGLTWMPWAPSARLDYCFADPLLAARLRRCDVITAPPAPEASDHFPLVAGFAS